MRALGIRRVASFYAAMGGIALVALATSGRLSEIIPPLFDGQAWAIALGLGFGVGLLVVLATRLAALRFDWAKTLSGEFRSMLGDFSHREIIAAALLSGIGEELLFRGTLQPAVGLWIATAIFGVVHVGPNRHFIPWTIMAFVVGLALGLMYQWTGNLLAPILAHVSINYLNLRHISLGSSNPNLELGILRRGWDLAG